MTPPSKFIPAHANEIPAQKRGLTGAPYTTSYFADEDVYRRFVRHNCVLSFFHCHGMRLHCSFTINSSVNVKCCLPAEVPWKRHIISLCGVLLRYSRVEPKVSGSCPTQYLIFSFFLSFFCFLCRCFL